MDSFFEKDFTWDNRVHFIYLLSHLSQVRFSLFCANQVKHLMKDERSVKVLETIPLFLEDKATKRECQAVAHAADAAANIAYNTYATYATYATNAANAATYNAAYAAVYAANTAAYSAFAASAGAAAASNAAADASNAAAYATYATYATNAAYAAVDLKQEQMSFLRSLVIDAFTETDKECWLLMTVF